MGNRLSVIDRLMTVTGVRVNVLFAYYVYRHITTCGVEKRKKTNTNTQIHILIRLHMYAYYWFAGVCERARSLGDSVNRLSVARVSNIQRMTDRVLSNMDVTTSRGQCVGSYSFVLSGVLEDNLKPHM